MEEDGLLYVAVVGEGGIARRARIELGYQNEAKLEVVSGVVEGDAIVVAGQGKLKDGDRTRVVTD